VNIVNKYQLKYGFEIIEGNSRNAEESGWHLEEI